MQLRRRGAGKRRQAIFQEGCEIYTTLASAVAGTAEIALRDKIAAGEITTLKDAVEELRRIKDEILAAIGDGEGV